MLRERTLAQMKKCINEKLLAQISYVETGINNTSGTWKMKLRMPNVRTYTPYYDIHSPKGLGIAARTKQRPKRSPAARQLQLGN